VEHESTDVEHESTGVEHESTCVEHESTSVEHESTCVDHECAHVEVWPRKWRWSGALASCRLMGRRPAPSLSRRRRCAWRWPGIAPKAGIETRGWQASRFCARRARGGGAGRRRSSRRDASAPLVGRQCSTWRDAGGP
jgi:hypothetical protein